MWSVAGRILKLKLTSSKLFHIQLIQLFQVPHTPGMTFRVWHSPRIQCMYEISYSAMPSVRCRMFWDAVRPWLSSHPVFTTLPAMCTASNAHWWTLLTLYSVHCITNSFKWMQYSFCIVIGISQINIQQQEQAQGLNGTFGVYLVVQCTSKKYHRDISITKLFSNQKTKSSESTRKESLVLELSFSGLSPNPRPWREKEKGKVFILYCWRRT